MTTPDSPSAPATPGCRCITCLDASGETVELFAGVRVPISGTMMVLCQLCGNKRCPHAKNHRHACTNSNEPGQKGSAYEDCAPPPAVARQHAQRDDAGCPCRACIDQRGGMDPFNSWMVLCATCGNKRCPHAKDCRLACTNSNAPGQEGSAYAHLPRPQPERGSDDIPVLALHCYHACLLPGIGRTQHIELIDPTAATCELLLAWFAERDPATGLLALRHLELHDRHGMRRLERQRLGAAPRVAAGSIGLLVHALPGPAPATMPPHA
jgi:hypothetical protein